jgi:hypothetical protein
MDKNLLHNEYEEAEEKARIENVAKALKAICASPRMQRIRDKNARDILKKVKLYHIDYDEKNINWGELEYKIFQYEELIEEARAQGVSWDFSIYDPIGLEQEVEKAHERETKWNRELRAWYFASVL